MGAETFLVIAVGDSAESAFTRAIESAHNEYGYGGYSGTIAEKSDFIMIEVPEDYKYTPGDYAKKLLEEDDERISDKWGPAGCIHLYGKRYLFFGWAPN